MWIATGPKRPVAGNSFTTVWSVPVRQAGTDEEGEPFLVVERQDAVAILACDEAGRKLLVKQHRFAADSLGWELPQGGIETGETALEAAARELEEEANAVSLTPGRMIGELFEAADWCTTKCTVVAYDRVVVRREGTPELRAQWLTDDEIAALILRGEIRDAATLAGLHLYGLTRP